jgi:NAD(P)-dependent dehydrogenase (short-subunit alcohol dehydrogenase family)
MLDGKSGGERRRMSGDGFEAGREKVAVVTAAGSGMGAACARELAERGYRVALVSPSGKAEDLAGELGGSASRARLRRVGISNRSLARHSTGTAGSMGS